MSIRIGIPAFVKPAGRIRPPPLQAGIRVCGVPGPSMGTPVALTAPATAPAAALPIAAAADEPHDEQQHDGADGCVDDRCGHPDTKLDTEPRQQPIPDEGADNTDDEIADDSKTGAAHDLQ